MLEAVEAFMLFEGHHGDPAGHHIEQEGAEVADQGDDEQRVGQFHIHLRRKDAEAVPEIVLVQGRQRRRLAAQIHQHRDYADNGRDDAQGPDGPVGRHSFAVQKTEVRRHFVIAAHGIGDSGPGAQAGKGRTDQGQEDRKGLDQHECLSGGITAEKPGADDDHHVAQRRA